ILGYRLSGGGSKDETALGVTEKAAIKKFNALKEKIHQIAAYVISLGGTFRGVYFFNFRIGDVNKQHDSNLDLLNHFRDEAAQLGYATIVIPQLGGEDADRHRKYLANETSTMINPDHYKGHWLFDMLEVYSGGSTKTHLDDRVKACFWHKVAMELQPRSFSDHYDNDPLEYPVVGFVGGRSGSTDLPAFVGMRVFSWEEPLFTALGKRPNPTQRSPWSASMYTKQGPQVLRLLNQYKIMTVGYLDLSSRIPGKNEGK
ncbi:hypothetical protein QBC35DRAFT_347499, partial [Podospora australis]